LRLEISSLKDNKGKSLSFKFEENLSPLDLGGEVIDFVSPVLVEGTATNVGSGILVDFTVNAEVVIDCDRCLQPVQIIIETNATEEFVEAKSARIPESGEEKEFHTYKGNVLDIGDVVEENILLGVPMKILCCEECKGICSSCGADLNIKECQCSQQDVDPRMEKLKDWFNG